MKQREAGLRERKKANQKLAIMEALLSALERRELGEIRVNDLCRQIGISKVTFFNYFRSKEQVLEYFVRKWQCEIYASVRREGLSGRRALYRILDSIAEHPAGAHVMNAVMMFFLKEKHYTPMEISPYEYSLFAPEAGADDGRPESVEALFAQAVGGLVGTSDAKGRAARHLTAGFWGVPLRAKITGDQDLRSAYREFVDLVLEQVLPTHDG